MAWVYLILAGLFEIGWMIGLKFSKDFTQLFWSVAMIASMSVSMIFLSFAIRTIPIGTAYAVWTGIGATGIAIMGILFFHEPHTLLRLIFIACIIVGIIGLKVTS